MLCEIYKYKAELLILIKYICKVYFYRSGSVLRNVLYTEFVPYSCTVVHTVKYFPVIQLIFHCQAYSCINLANLLV